MSDWAAKRFWKTTDLREAEGGFEVTLDGRTVKTPAKTALIVPTRALAERIQEEWDAQEDAIDPNTMPTTKGANAAIDKVTISHKEVADMLGEYGDSDLLCYRAPHPKELAERQAEIWDPILDWGEAAYGARLETREGIMHKRQTPEALAALRAPMEDMSAFELAAFHDLVTLSGSLVMAYAVTKEHFTPDAAWDAAQLDDTFQAELWGEDEEAMAALEVKRESFAQAAWFFKASKT